MADFNLFLILGLNPAEPLDEVKFQQALKAKTDQWNREREHPLRGAAARANSALVPELREVWQDKSRLEAQRQEAVKLASVEQAQKLKTFEEELAGLITNGYVLRKRVDEWGTELKGILTYPEIERRITVPIVDKPPEVAARPQLESTKAKSIRAKLDQIKQRSLYTLLHDEVDNTLFEGSRRDALERAALQLSQLANKTANRTPEVALKTELGGLASEVFRTDEMRARYDETLRQERMEALVTKHMEIFRDSGSVNAQQARRFLEEARAAGYSMVEGIKRLQRLGMERKWPVTLPDDDALARRWVCGQDQTLNDESGQKCRVCGAPKTYTCPECQAACPSADQACVKCGFPVGARFTVAILANEAERLLTEDHPTEALAQVREARHHWQATKANDLSHRLDVISQHVQEREQEARDQEARLRRERADATRQLNELVASRHLFAAKQLIQSFPPGLISDPKFYIDQIEPRIQRARERYARVPAADASADDRLRFLEEVQAICVDYPGVAEELRRVPPGPPSALKVTVVGHTIQLRWQRSTTAGANRYRVVRKMGARPHAATDGSLVATVASDYYDDAQPIRGALVYYAVFTERAAGGDSAVCSQTGALSAHATLLPEPVIYPNPQVSDGGVEISWQLPPSAKRIVVTRKEGMPPQSDGDGTLVPLADSLPRQMRETGLRNGTRYFYRINAYFEDDAGQSFAAATVVEVTPETPPTLATIQRVSKSRQGEHFLVEIVFTPPSRGEAMILRSTKPPRPRPGQMVATMLVGQHGTELPVQPSPARETVAPGVYYYTALTNVRNTGQSFIGNTVPCALLDDVTDLTYINLGASLRLMWHWPAASQEALVGVSRHDYPDLAAPDAASTVTTLPKSRYDGLGGHFDVPFTGQGDIFIRVAVRATLGGQTIISDGERARARLASMKTVEYHFTRSNRAAPQLILRPREPVTMPPFLVRSKRGGIPLNRNDGELVTKLEGIQATPQGITIPLPPLAYPSPCFAKLFLVNEDDFDWIRLLHPVEKDTRLA